MLTIVSIYSKYIGCVLCLLNRADRYVWIRRKNYRLFVFEMHLLKAWGCTITVKSHLQRYPTINTQLLLLSNTVVLFAFLLRKAPLVFLAVIFSILIFFNKAIQKSHCCWVLAQVCTAPMLSQSEKILRSFKSKSHFANCQPQNSTQKRQRKG